MFLLASFFCKFFFVEDDSPNLCTALFTQLIQLPHSHHTIRFFSHCLCHTLHLTHWRQHILSLLSLPMWLHLFSNNANPEFYQVCFANQPKLIKLFSKLQSQPVKWQDANYIWSLFRSLCHWMDDCIVNQHSVTPQEEQLLQSVMEMVIHCCSQIPTRRFVVPVLQYLHLHIRLNVLLVRQLLSNKWTEMVQCVEYYLQFPIDLQTNSAMNQKERMERMAQTLDTFQRICFAQFEKLGVLSVMNHSQLMQRKAIETECNKLTTKEVMQLLQALHLPMFEMKQFDEQQMHSIGVEIIIAHIQSLKQHLYSFDINLDTSTQYSGKIMPTYLSLEDYLTRQFLIQKQSTSQSLKEELSTQLTTSQSMYAIDSLVMETSLRAKVKCKEWIDQLQIHDHLMLLSLQEDKTIKEWKWCSVMEIEDSKRTEMMVGLDSITFWIQCSEPLPTNVSFTLVCKLNTNQSAQVSILKQLQELLHHPYNEDFWFVDQLLGFSSVNEEEEQEFSKESISLHNLLTRDSIKEFLPNAIVKDDEDAISIHNQLLYLRNDSSQSSHLNKQQLDCVLQCMLTQQQVILISSIPGTGYTHVANQLIQQWLHNASKTLVIAKYPQILSSVFANLSHLPIALINRICFAEKETHHLDILLQRRHELLQQVSLLMSTSIVTCEQSYFYYVTTVQTLWKNYLKHGGEFPWKEYVNMEVTSMEHAKQLYKHIQMIFEELQVLRPLELIRDSTHRLHYLMNTFAQVIAVTQEQLASHYVSTMDCHFENVMVLDSHLIPEMELIPLLLRFTNQKQTKRIICFGDAKQAVTYQASLSNNKNQLTSFFERMERMQLGKHIVLNQIQSNNPLIQYWKPYYENLNIISSSSPTSTSLLPLPNCLFLDTCSQVSATNPQILKHLNLGEAELIVLFYMYLRLHSIPKEDIILITNTTLQRNLIREVMEKRGIAKNVLFGLPHFVGTIEEWGSQQSRIVLVSAVYTKDSFGNSFGDVRKWLRMWSSATEQLIVFGNTEHWNQFPFMQPSIKEVMMSNTELELLGIDKKYKLLVSASNPSMVKQMGAIIKEFTMHKLQHIAKEQTEYANKLQQLSAQQLKK